MKFLSYFRSFQRKRGGGVGSRDSIFGVMVRTDRGTDKDEREGHGIENKRLTWGN